MEASGHTYPIDRRRDGRNRPSGGRVAVKEPGLRLSSDKRQSGWETASGEGGVAISSPEGLGSYPEGAHEVGVELVEHLAGSLCGRMD